MHLKDLMTTTVITIGPEAPLKEAARRMIEAGVSGLPATTDEGTLVGMITEADFVKSEAKRRADRRAHLLRWFTKDEPVPATEQKVADMMTNDVLTLAPNIDHSEAARLMQTWNVKRVPVVDEVGALIGLVSRSDILRAFARSDAAIVEELSADVMRRVLWIDPRRVRIGCEDGNLALAGRLETKSDAQLLVEMAKRLDGVVSVSDHLTWDVDNTRLEMVAPRPAPPNW